MPVEEATDLACEHSFAAFIPELYRDADQFDDDTLERALGIGSQSPRCVQLGAQLRPEPPALAARQVLGLAAKMKRVAKPLDFIQSAHEHDARQRAGV